MPEISLIICTHNPRADYLRRTLDSLRSQTLAKERWELLVVDNASEPALCPQMDLAWHPQPKCVVEKRRGLTFARQRGIQESTGGWIVFVDDDNVLTPDYLALVLAIQKRQPRCAVFGAGQLIPEFETKPAPEVGEFLPKLALRSVASEQCGGRPAGSGCVPFGAGLCVRRDVALRFIEMTSVIQDTMVFGRNGGELFSHEDELFSWIAARGGDRFGIFPELKLTHLISAGRVTRDYFLRLIYYSAISHWILRYLMENQRPARMSWRKWVWLARHVLRNGTMSARANLAEFRGEDRAAILLSEQKFAVLQARLKT